MSLKRNFSLSLNYEWQKTEYNFLGNRLNLFPRGSYPAIYTWVLKSRGGEKSYYLGETSNLRGRVNFYASPGQTQQTNLRLNALMRRSRRVYLYILKINKLILNGEKINPDEALKSEYIRRGIEGLLCNELRRIKKGSIMLNK